MKHVRQKVYIFKKIVNESTITRKTRIQSFLGQKFSQKS